MFSNRNADELILLDTLATSQDRRPHLDIVKEIADETFMPFTVGGGIRTVDDIWALLTMGVTAGDQHGGHRAPGTDHRRGGTLRAPVHGGIPDYKERRDGSYEIYTHSGSRPTGIDPVQAAVDLEAAGAGEILLTSIDRDGTWRGMTRLDTGRGGRGFIPVIAWRGRGDFASRLGLL